MWGKRRCHRATIGSSIHHSLTTTSSHPLFRQNSMTGSIFAKHWKRRSVMHRDRKLGSVVVVCVIVVSIQKPIPPIIVKLPPPHPSPPLSSPKFKYVYMYGVLARVANEYSTNWHQRAGKCLNAPIAQRQHRHVFLYNASRPSWKHG